MINNAWKAKISDLEPSADTLFLVRLAQAEIANHHNESTRVLTLLPEEYLQKLEQQENEKFANAYQYRGAALHDQGEWHLASESYRIALRFQDDSMPIRSALADCLIHIGESEEAEEALELLDVLVGHYEKHVETDGSRECRSAHAFQLQHRALVKSRVDQEQSAIHDWNQAIGALRALIEEESTPELMTRLYDCLGGRGYDLLQQGCFEEGIVSLSESIDIGEGLEHVAQCQSCTEHMAQRHFTRGCLRQNVGRHRKAIDDYERGAAIFAKLEDTSDGGMYRGDVLRCRLYILGARISARAKEIWEGS